MEQLGAINDRHHFFPHQGILNWLGWFAVLMAGMWIGEGTAYVEVANWTNPGPGGGGALPSAAIHPTVQDRLFISCDSNGLYVKDGSAPWYFVGREVRSDAQQGGHGSVLGEISISPDQSGSVVLAGCGGGVLRNDSQGAVGVDEWEYIDFSQMTSIQSWFEVHSFVLIDYTEIDEATVFCGRGRFEGDEAEPMRGVPHMQSSVRNAGATGDHMLKSTNGGLDWSPISLPEIPATDDDTLHVMSLVRDPHPDRESVIYAATTNGIYVSEDTGDSWYWVDDCQPDVQTSIREMTAIKQGNDTFLSLTAESGPRMWRVRVWSEGRSRDLFELFWASEGWVEIAYDDVCPPNNNWGIADDDYFYHVATNGACLITGIATYAKGVLWRSSNPTAADPTFDCIANMDTGGLAQMHWAPSGLGYGVHHIAINARDPNDERVMFGNNSTYYAPEYAGWLSSPEWQDLTSLNGNTYDQSRLLGQRS